MSDTKKNIILTKRDKEFHIDTNLNGQELCEASVVLACYLSGLYASAEYQGGKVFSILTSWRPKRKTGHLKTYFLKSLHFGNFKNSVLKWVTKMEWNGLQECTVLGYKNWLSDNRHQNRNVLLRRLNAEGKKVIAISGWKSCSWGNVDTCGFLNDWLKNIVPGH